MNTFTNRYGKENLLFKEISDGKAIEINTGENLINRYGRYSPAITFVVPASEENVEWTAMDTAETRINIDWDGDPRFIVGDYWVSKKGTRCFRPNKDGKHLLIENEWGGCFNPTRGNEYEAIKDVALYSKRAASNGGGLGSNYYILPNGYRRIYTLDEI